MDKESLPSQLNADYYRRRAKSLSLASAESLKHGSTMEPPPHNKLAHAGAPTAGAGGAAPPPPPSNPPPPRKPPPPRARGVLRGFATRAKNFAGKTLRVGGTAGCLVAAASFGAHYYECKQVDDFFSTGDTNDGDPKSKQFKCKKKRVLHLPFDNLKLIEHRTRQFNIPSNKKPPTITLEVKELVSLLHRAASDPTITALYADFGESGMRHPIGYAHAEEIRNAVRIFNESHRVHRNPNVHHDPVFAMMRNGEPKPSYAFGHSYKWNEYFLASAFNYVHLQARGHLELFGTSTTNLFLRGALDKYGIKAHVFRHGEYKNAPSIFTDKKYSKPHLENVKSMAASLDETIRTGVRNSRGMLNFDNVMWQSVSEFGNLASGNAREIGLVDLSPPVDPLISLLDVNKEEEKKKKKKKNKKKIKGDDDKKTKCEIEGKDDKQNKKTKSREKLEAKFGIHESLSKFTATESIPLSKYKQMLDKKEKIERRRKGMNDTLQKMSESSTATSMILSAFGWQPNGGSSSSSSSKTKREKVAVVTVSGNINNSVSYEVIESLRRIRKDKSVKCMVLRVDSPGGSVVSSEAILEEIKLLDKPVICSMSNAAASGGYYISMNSEKIFAQPTTLTGSIGVFGIKVDASKWAESYGIHSDQYPRGSHATAMHPLTPLTPNTKNNISRMVLDYYDYFKSLVAEGRSLSAKEVERVAKGRVWTGEQAKEEGLVDALGGLDRAISYARTTHTTAEDVEVEHWPRRTLSLEDLNWSEMLMGTKESSISDIFEKLRAAIMGIEEEGGESTPSLEQSFLSELAELKFAEKPHFLLTMDENTALDLILRGE